MFAHGDNLAGKEQHQTKYRDAESRRYLGQIRKKYDAWKAANLALKGPVSKSSKEDLAIIEKRTVLLNAYKDFVDQEHFATKFDSRSNLHSSILEEFMFYLFKDLVGGIDQHALLGKSRTFKDIFFTGDGFQNMVRKPRILVEKKDHDFAIGLKITAREFRYREGYVKNPIYPDAVMELYSLVRNHLTTDWTKGISGGLKKGYLI